MKKFKTAAEIPPDCIATPTVYFAPRPGAQPSGRLDGHVFYHRADVSNLLTADDWRERRRKVKAGEAPLAHRGLERIGVFAEWQTDG
jgi:hypothetical protein